MKALLGNDLHAILNSLWDGAEFQASRALSQIRDHGILWIGRWVGPTAGMDALKYKGIYCPCWESNGDWQNKFVRDMTERIFV
jgi:hypothetical protein